MARSLVCFQLLYYSYNKIGHFYFIGVRRSFAFKYLSLVKIALFFNSVCVFQIYLYKHKLFKVNYQCVVPGSCYSVTFNCRANKNPMVRQK